MADKSMEGLNTFTAQDTATVDASRKLRIAIQQKNAVKLWLKMFPKWQKMQKLQ